MRSRMIFGWAGGLLLAVVVFTAGGCGGTPEDASGGGRLEAPIDATRWTTFSNPGSTVGGLVYVPVYSSVFHNTGDRELLLAVTLSIHNVNPDESIEVTGVAYFNTDGRRLRDFVEEPVVLGPLATKQYVIPRADTSGGTGANFLVKWEAAKPVTRPAIESLMVNTSSQLGMSFTCQGVLVRELRHGDRENP